MHQAKNSSLSSRRAGTDLFAEQLELARVHPQLVPMQRQGGRYLIHPTAKGWRRLPDDRGFAGYGLTRGLRMLLDVLTGLRALHETYSASGVPFVHGEVAPLHFRIDPGGVCRLVPLIERHYATDAEVPEMALGYSSPERLIGEEIDPRADVFSAGILLWEALACRRLFDERSADAVINQMLSDEPTAPNVPAHFSWVCPLEAQLSRALEVRIQRRSIDCGELADAITRVALDRLPSHAEAFPAGKGVAKPVAATPASQPPVHASTRPPRESSIFVKPTLAAAPNSMRSARLEPKMDRLAPLRFTTVRMSAVQLQENGLFDPHDSSIRKSERAAVAPQVPAARAVPVLLPSLPAPRALPAPPPLAAPVPPPVAEALPPSPLPRTPTPSRPPPLPRRPPPPPRRGPPPLPSVPEIPDLAIAEPPAVVSAVVFTEVESDRKPAWELPRLRLSKPARSSLIAMGILVVGMLAALVFEKGSAAGTPRPARPLTHAPTQPNSATVSTAPMATAASPKAAPTQDVSSESKGNPHSEVSEPTMAPEHSSDPARERAGRQNPASDAPARRVIQQLKNYGI